MPYSEVADWPSVIPNSRYYIPSARQARLHFYKRLCLSIESSFRIIHRVAYLYGRFNLRHIKIHLYAIVIETDRIFLCTKR